MSHLCCICMHLRSTIKIAPCKSRCNNWSIVSSRIDIIKSIFNPAGSVRMTILAPLVWLLSVEADHRRPSTVEYYGRAVRHVKEPARKLDMGRRHGRGSDAPKSLSAVSRTGADEGRGTSRPEKERCTASDWLHTSPIGRYRLSILEHVRLSTSVPITSLPGAPD